MTVNDRQEPAVADARLFRPGVLRCAKCGFRLVSSTLWLGNGAVTPRETTEHCPNDGAPMWRVSWEEECRESDKCWEQQVERAVAAEAALAVAIEALAPFAEMARRFAFLTADERVHQHTAKGSANPPKDDLTVADFRRAENAVRAR